MKQLLQADWIAPMSRPPFRDGAVVFENGIILAVGPSKELRNTHPDAEVENLGNAIILPGLVNAHVHLELSNAHPIPLPEGGFVGWLRAIRAQTQVPPAELEQATILATNAGIAQCLKFGVTAVGDITRQPQITRPLLQQAGLHGTSYGEIIAAAKLRHQLEPQLANASADFPAPSPGTPGEGWGEGSSSSTLSSRNSALPHSLRPGLTPHAPYTVEPEAYKRCLEVAQQQNLPLATHLAETPDEATFLADHTGPFRDLWNAINLWDAPPTKNPGGPIRLAQSLGLLNYPTLLAHVNYCDDEELRLLAKGKASVVYCPRTHQYFGHRPHRWRDMLAAGINVAVGTDSCASSPNLNLVDDLRLLHNLAPDMPALALWQMATLRAALAIDMTTRCGQINYGAPANLAIFKTNTSDPLTEILESDALPSPIRHAHTS